MKNLFNFATTTEVGHIYATKETFCFIAQS